MTSATASTARPLPPEREDPREAMLDLIEDNLQRALDMDLAPQLAARIVRLFPELTYRPADPPPAVASPAASSVRPVARYSDIERAIRLCNVRTFVLASRAVGREAHVATLDHELELLKATDGDAGQ